MALSPYIKNSFHLISLFRSFPLIWEGFFVYNREYLTLRTIKIPIYLYINTNCLILPN